jgi:dipeptidyl aminopeptidase/acylaminoacyl peptidase
MGAVDEVVKLPYVDKDRLGAAGASFGGYMVNWILGHTDRFKALVSHAGVFNLTSMYGVTEELWFPEWEFKGSPWTNPEQYSKYSPSNYVKNFKTPTLVTHGELDYRVPIAEGFQLFTSLQKMNVPSRMLYFPDEGHWVLKPQNSELWYKTVLSWLNQHLK